MQAWQIVLVKVGNVTDGDEVVSPVDGMGRLGFEPFALHVNHDTGGAPEYVVAMKRPRNMTGKELAFARRTMHLEQQERDKEDTARGIWDDDAEQS